jgi:hypothetical protein
MVWPKATIGRLDVSRLKKTSRKGPYFMLATGLIRSSKRSHFFTVSTLLTALLAASFVVLVGESPARAAACSSGVAPSGNGLVGTPYLIATAQNLIWMSEQTANWNNQHFRQTASIDLGGCQFTPIGKRTTAHFKGTYDGGGFTIEGLYIRETTTYAGLFSDMNETAVFKNIGLVDVDVETTDGSAGALAGRLTGNNARVFNSYSTGRVVGKTSTGGLVGNLWGGANISNSFSTASVTITMNNGSGGGLVGSVVNSGTVTNVYAAGPVQMASGFSSTNIGGLSGQGASPDVSPTQTAAFFDSTVSPLSNNAIGTGKSTTEMKTRATFSPAWAIVDGWEAFNFAEPAGTNYWGICSYANNGYPFLLGAYTTDPCVAPPSNSGSGSSGGFYAPPQTTITSSGTTLTVNLNKTTELLLSGSNLNLVIQASVGGENATINFVASNSGNLVISTLPLLPSGKYTLTLMTPTGLVPGEVEVGIIARITELRAIEASGKLSKQVRSEVRKQNLAYDSAGTLSCWGVTTSSSGSALALAKQKAEKVCAYAKRQNPELDVVASSRTGTGKPARNQVVKLQYLK